MTEQKTLSPRAWSELILLGVIWGGIFLTTRIALDEIGVATSVFWRTSLAAILLWLVVFLRGQKLVFTGRTVVGFVGMGLLNNVIPFGLLNWSQLFLASGLVSIFNATTAIFGVVVAAIFLADERLGARKLTGALIGLAGVIAAIGPTNLAALDPTNLAQFAALAATLSYAFAGVWARKMLAGLPAETAAAGMLTASALITLPAALIIDGPLDLTLAPATWGGIAYMSVIGTALAYLLYYRVLAAAGSGNLMLVTLIIPPVAIALGAWVRAEQITSGALMGFALIALGLVIIDGRLLRRRQKV
ncbi:DMT family transporter [Alisedimentitalea sp. MJ-SS2]|uniref:DMT family transporter n=1 Tax=Aliisedimentitalea sp. MJ-SS2 TaxID=3049795 RepID=UPI0029127117|nr:DMT family transporter [Alisedimentitalea sp. MJ-SS2]MDU8926871.1 DMT family transporter [Alisedimentitalea sp. MJ-SS2]